jgi:2-methylcitrate dehydratase PrpD
MRDSASLELASYVLEIVRGDVPPAAMEAATSRLLHAIGLSLANSELEQGSTAWRAVSRDSGTCLALGFPGGLSASAASFVNAVTGYSSLQEDTGTGYPVLGKGGHPGTYVVPAALAAAETAAASGRELLCGIVAGYEVVARINAAMPASFQRVFSAVPLMGPFGAAAAVAAIYGCDAVQLSGAITIAANLAGGVKQSLFDGTDELYLHAGFAARAGLLAGELATAGVRTSQHGLEGSFGFFETFGGESGNLEMLTAPTPELAVCDVGTKRFPSCVQNQETIALIMGQAPAQFHPSEIARVTLFRPESGRNGRDVPGVASHGPYTSALQRQMSARFTAAAALLQRPVDDVRYFLNASDDVEVASLAERVDFAQAVDNGVEVTVMLRNGDELRLHGDVSGVMFPTALDVRDLFIKRGSSRLGGMAASRAATLVDELQSSRDIRPMLETLRCGYPAQ